jgi:hypothetical protein
MMRVEQPREPSAIIFDHVARGRGGDRRLCAHMW